MMLAALGQAFGQRPSAWLPELGPVAALAVDVAALHRLALLRSQQGSGGDGSTLTPEGRHTAARARALLQSRGGGMRG